MLILGKKKLLSLTGENFWQEGLQKSNQLLNLFYIDMAHFCKIRLLMEFTVKRNFFSFNTSVFRDPSTEQLVTNLVIKLRSGIIFL